jgi:hypothetical protein
MTKFEYRDVESSNIAAIAYVVEYADPDDDIKMGTLGVKFKTKVEGELTEYRFIGVPEDRFLELASANSTGKAFNELIRGKYESEKYSEEKEV